MATPAVVITESQKQQFRDEGFFILEKVIPDEQLRLLREECRFFIDKTDEEMAQKQTATRGITHKSKRYFIADRHKESEKLQSFLFSDLMADICHATLGDEAYLFWEQFVVKGAEVGMKFSWHQDSGYLGYDHWPYLSCWCALDDMSEDNGTVYILPFSRAGTKSRQDHIIEKNSNDKVGYFGDDPGIPVSVPAGSIAVFSSVTFHRSGANTTDRMRRVYLAQYSSKPIMTEDGTRLWGNAVPLIKNGERVNPVQQYFCP